MVLKRGDLAIGNTNLKARRGVQVPRKHPPLTASTGRTRGLGSEVGGGPGVGEPRRDP